MNSSSHPERFHAFDATRAFALLLGVFLHAAWFYMPVPLLTPATDVQANHFTGWFFYTVHMFRMQLFFLIAGFFARLVVCKRGERAFALNRLKRIALPFIVGWIVLYPLTIMVWLWGRNLSGQNAAPVPPHLATLFVMFSGGFMKPVSEGGMFSLVHLWFLYYLVLISLLMLAVRTVMSRFKGLVDRLCTFADRATLVMTRSPFGVLLFALLITPMMFVMDGWLGVDTPARSRLPVAHVTLAYMMFFVMGWFVHRSVTRLAEMFRCWKAFLVAGLVGSVGMYAAFISSGAHETDLPRGSVTRDMINDWSVFRQSLLAHSAESDEITPAYRLWMKLPPASRQQVRQSETFTLDEQVGILLAINTALQNPGLLTDPPMEPTVVAGEPPKMPPRDIEVIKANRAAVQPYWAGVSPKDVRASSWYHPVKAAYSFGYSIVSVCLIFGCLGAFQTMCLGYSPVWRYLADSSYWVYLAHIPLLPSIEMLMFQWEITAWVKLPLLIFLSLVPLYLSYHYCVRSTWIGKALNGRKHPFHANPLEVLRAPGDSG